MIKMLKFILVALAGSTTALTIDADKFSCKLPNDPCSNLKWEYCCVGTCVPEHVFAITGICTNETTVTS